MQPPKKTGLNLLIAVGKGKPAGPAGEMPMEGKEAPEGAMMGGEEEGGEQEENCITLPKGFQPPQDASDGKPFTTTVRGKIMDGKFYVEALGDMPMHSEEGETQEEEESESPEEEAQEEEEPPAEEPDEVDKMLEAKNKRRMFEEKAARKVFQGG